MSEIKDKKMDKVEKWWWEWRLLVQRNGGIGHEEVYFPAGRW